MFIRRLTIERYRGIQSLRWFPPGRVNCLIGPGDTGKSTILSAIERVLDPRPAPAATEFDYYRRQVDRGFQITAVLGDLDDDFLASIRTPPVVGWLKNKLTALPDERGAEPVLVARVGGSPDLELTHELLTPGAAENSAFSPGVRRRLFLSRIASGGRAFSELRLGRGSLLDRHVNAAEFQGQLRANAASLFAGLQLPKDVEEAIRKLRTLFEGAGLPEELSLGFITPQGWSLLSLLGLVEGPQSEEAIPLAFAGGGTKQLAMFRLATGLMGASPVVLMDEPELGLEPYRQRKLVSEIRTAVGDSGQAFLTTHSPAILEALGPREVSRLTPRENPVTLRGKHVRRVQTEAPDSFLSRLPILCEGPTESGFLQPVLDSFAARDELGNIDAMGIRLIGRRGQPQMLDEADQLLKLGLTLGVFPDNEATLSGRRQRLAMNPQCAFASWSEVRNVEEAVSHWLPFSDLPGIVQLAEQLRGRPKEELLQQVGGFIGTPGQSDLNELVSSHREQEVRQALSQAMLSKNNPWFKTEERGRALGQHLLQVGLPKRMNEMFDAFWVRILELGGWAPTK